MAVTIYFFWKKANPFQTFASLIVLITLSSLKAVSVSANENNTSSNKYDEEVSIIPLREDCSTVEPIETYSVRNGEIEGILYATACEKGYRLPNPLVDYVKYVFIDTGGTSSERCYGIINTSTPSGINYSWEFKGAVPGYSCGKINQTINRLYPKGY